MFTEPVCQELGRSRAALPVRVDPAVPLQLGVVWHGPTKLSADRVVHSELASRDPPCPKPSVASPIRLGLLTICLFVARCRSRLLLHRPVVKVASANVAGFAIPLLSTLSPETTSSWSRRVLWERWRWARLNTDHWRGNPCRDSRWPRRWCTGSAIPPAC